MQSPEGLCISSLLEVQDLLLLEDLPAARPSVAVPPGGEFSRPGLEKRMPPLPTLTLLEESKLQTEQSSNKSAHLSLPAHLSLLVHLSVEMWDHATAVALGWIIMLVIIHELFLQSQGCLSNNPSRTQEKQSQVFFFLLLVL